MGTEILEIKLITQTLTGSRIRAIAKYFVAMWIRL